MAGEIRAVIANVVTRINAITADSEYDGTTSFTHDVEAFDADDLGGNPRVYVVLDTGDRQNIGTMGTDVSPSQVIAGLEVAVVYPRAVNAYEMMRTIAEDTDRIRYELERATGYEQSTTTIYNRTVGRAEYLSTGERDAPVVVKFPITVTYEPTF